MKEEIKPMERPTREPLPLCLAQRCLARTRARTPCQKAAATGKKRCRMHGGEKAAARLAVNGTAVIATGSSPAKRSPSGALSGLSSETFAALYSART